MFSDKNFQMSKFNELFKKRKLQIHHEDDEEEDTNLFELDPQEAFSYIWERLDDKGRLELESLKESEVFKLKRNTHKEFKSNNNIRYYGIF